MAIFVWTNVISKAHAWYDEQRNFRNSNLPSWVQPFAKNPMSAFTGDLNNLSAQRQGKADLQQVAANEAPGDITCFAMWDRSGPDKRIGGGTVFVEYPASVNPRESAALAFPDLIQDAGFSFEAEVGGLVQAYLLTRDQSLVFETTPKTLYELGTETQFQGLQIGNLYLNASRTSASYPNRYAYIFKFTVTQNNVTPLLNFTQNLTSPARRVILRQTDENGAIISEWASPDLVDPDPLSIGDYAWEVTSNEDFQTGGGPFSIDFDYQSSQSYQEPVSESLTLTDDVSISSELATPLVESLTLTEGVEATEFQPDSLANLTVWLDPAENVTLDTNNRVTEWVDQALGTVYTAVGSLNFRRIAVATPATLNGHPGLYDALDTGTFQLQGPLPLVASSLIGPNFEAFIVVATTTLTTGGLQLFTVGNGSNDGFALEYSGSGNFGVRCGNASLMAVTATANSAQILSVFRDNATGNVTVQKNGGSPFTSARPTPNLTSPDSRDTYVFRNNTGITSSMYIGEIILYNTLIGATNRNLVINYLKDKFNIT
jgi:hypothetical protein